MHGGAAPQVKAAARERIAAMVDPALGVMYRAMKMGTKKIGPHSLALVAARDILDRAGYKATDKIQLTGGGPSGELVHATPAELLKAELDALHERIKPKPPNG
jgi:hypothetical protein